MLSFLAFTVKHFKVYRPTPARIRRACSPRPLQSNSVPRPIPIVWQVIQAYLPVEDRRDTSGQVIRIWSSLPATSTLNYIQRPCALMAKTGVPAASSPWRNRAVEVTTPLMADLWAFLKTATLIVASSPNVLLLFRFMSKRKGQPAGCPFVES